MLESMTSKAAAISSETERTGARRGAVAEVVESVDEDGKGNVNDDVAACPPRAVSGASKGVTDAASPSKLPKLPKDDCR